jgi:hypothetical protein
VVLVLRAKTYNQQAMFHYLIASVTKVNSNRSYLVQVPTSVIQAPVSASNIDMYVPEHAEKLCLRRWCGAIVLIAVCSLTVSLVTRYTAPLGLSSRTAKVLHVHGAPAAKRQHLAKDAVDWIPPVTRIRLLVPTSFSAIVATTDPVLNRVSEQSLYNRPPPSSTFLS